MLTLLIVLPALCDPVRTEQAAAALTTAGSEGESAVAVLDPFQDTVGSFSLLDLAKDDTGRSQDPFAGTRQGDGKEESGTAERPEEHDELAPASEHISADNTQSSPAASFTVDKAVSDGTDTPAFAETHKTGSAAQDPFLDLMMEAEMPQETSKTQEMLDADTHVTTGLSDAAAGSSSPSSSLLDEDPFAFSRSATASAAEPPPPPSGMQEPSTQPPAGKAAAQRASEALSDSLCAVNLLICSWVSVGVHPSARDLVSCRHGFFPSARSSLRQHEHSGTFRH